MTSWRNVSLKSIPIIILLILSSFSVFSQGGIKIVEKEILQIQNTTGGNITLDNWFSLFDLFQFSNGSRPEYTHDGNFTLEQLNRVLGNGTFENDSVHFTDGGSAAPGNGERERIWIIQNDFLAGTVSRFHTAEAATGSAWDVRVDPFIGNSRVIERCVFNTFSTPVGEECEKAIAQRFNGTVAFENIVSMRRSLQTLPNESFGGFADDIMFNETINSTTSTNTGHITCSIQSGLLSNLHDLTTAELVITGNDCNGELIEFNQTEPMTIASFYVPVAGGTFNMINGATVSFTNNYNWENAVNRTIVEFGTPNLIINDKLGAGHPNAVRGVLDEDPSVRFGAVIKQPITFSNLRFYLDDDGGITGERFVEFIPRGIPASLAHNNSFYSDFSTIGFGEGWWTYYNRSTQNVITQMNNEVVTTWNLTGIDVSRKLYTGNLSIRENITWNFYDASGGANCGLNSNLTILCNGVPVGR